MKYLQMGTDCYRAGDNKAIAEAIKSFIIYQQGNLGTLKVWDEPTMIEAKVMELDLDDIFSACDDEGDYQTTYYSKKDKLFHAVYAQPFKDSEGNCDEHNWRHSISYETALDTVKNHNLTRWLFTDIEANYHYCVTESYEQGMFYYMTKDEANIFKVVHKEYAMSMKEDSCSTDAWLALDAVMNRYLR